ncbi:hypothetical protein D554_2425 [Bordetella holmesii 30539]|uniref:N-acetyltransferase YedL n=1 Tax=Bordetella holmesii 1058 TaxID=1247648 RepID=A0ABN0RVF1_9BORD|nr:hypothetical protein D558_2458 [Bordetella holmesii 44057]EWM42431.1 hypothetical protein D556_2458 [Bordetella holmesii 41130]EWM47703.1 hypothetical protein D555_2494 [Bordetella holmesii 35009]EWM51873.1 hypothetical protein D557_1735 [Bordetella holmesii 70147]EXF87170.1 hypothetical protein D554_2425 [Bordetella holmesii 30539]EXX93174.1 hypothetical protein D559_0561 [Bordetella holmesii 1058]
MHGLQAVSHIRKRPPDDYAHRVIEVTAAHLFFQRYRKRLLGKGIHIYSDRIVCKEEPGPGKRGTRAG